MFNTQNQRHVRVSCRFSQEIMVGSLAKHKYVLLTFLVLKWTPEHYIVDILFKKYLLRADCILGDVLNAKE